MTGKDYYRILGVEQEATPQQIKEAYRRLAFQFHPDRNKGDPAAVETMKELNEAYAVLSDPGKRSQYDLLSRQYGSSASDHFRQSHSQEDIFRGSDIGQVFEEMARNFGFRGFEDVFRESYGKGYQTFHFDRPGFKGRGFFIFGPGFGREAGTREQQKPGLLGGLAAKLAGYAMKKVLSPGRERPPKDWHDSITLEPEVAARGGRVRYTDPFGTMDVYVSIPAGVREGQKIRLKGAMNGIEGGGEEDLYLTVRIKKPLTRKIAELFHRHS